MKIAHDYVFRNQWMKWLELLFFYALCIQPLSAQSLLLIKDLDPLPHTSSTPEGYVGVGQYVFFGTGFSETGFQGFDRLWMVDTFTNAVSEILPEEGYLSIPTLTDSFAFFTGYAANGSSASLYRMQTTTLAAELLDGPWPVSNYAIERRTVAPVLHDAQIFYLRNGDIWRFSNQMPALYYALAMQGINSAKGANQLVGWGDSLYFTCNTLFFAGGSYEDLYALSVVNNDTARLVIHQVGYMQGGGNTYTQSPSHLAKVEDKLVVSGKTTMHSSSGDVKGPIRIFALDDSCRFTSSVSLHGNVEAAYTFINQQLTVLSYWYDLSFTSLPPTLEYTGMLYHCLGDPVAGNIPIKVFAPKVMGVGRDIIALHNIALFAADGEDGHGQELWCADGIPEHTHLLKDIWAGEGSSSITAFGRDSHYVYFAALDGQNWGIWQTDGTANGTQKLTGFATTADHPIRTIFPYGDRLLVTADDGQTGLELWTTGLSPPFSSTTTMPTSKRLVITPNPATNELSVRIPEAGHAEIVVSDITGRAIKRMTVEINQPSEEIHLLLEGASNGTYLLRIIISAPYAAQKATVYQSLFCRIK